jgi:hypothetical protein
VVPDVRYFCVCGVAAAALPAAKRRKLEPATAAPQQPEQSAADATPAPCSSAAAGVAGAPAAAAQRRGSSASAGLTAAEEAALLDAGRRSGFAWEQTSSPHNQMVRVSKLCVDQLWVLGLGFEDFRKELCFMSSTCGCDL